MDAFCDEVLRRGDLAADTRFASNTLRVQHRGALDAAITGAFSGLTAEQVVERLDAAGIASARMNTVQEFVAHGQLSARHRWRDIESPAGPVGALLPPIDIEGIEPVMGPIPAVGEHTDAILQELGYEAPVIAAWRRAGIV